MSQLLAQAGRLAQQATTQGAPSTDRSAGIYDNRANGDTMTDLSATNTDILTNETIFDFQWPQDVTRAADEARRAASEALADGTNAPQRSEPQAPVIAITPSGDGRTPVQEPNARYSPVVEAEVMTDAANPPRRNIDDCIKALMTTSTPVTPFFERVDIRDGDTWAFIQPPAQEPEQNDYEYRRIVTRYSHPFRVSSAVLKATESPFICGQLNSPTKQFRLIRRLNVKQDIMAANSIKYVLDLTPPVEGEEAVELTEELSCPPGVAQWVRTSQQWKVSATMVGGIDEHTSTSEGPVDTRPIVPDYTPLRHRLCIERVLAVLHELDPWMDSAPKVYTTVMAATKHLQVPAHKLTLLADYVVRWARAVPNSFFIELHPEVALKLAEQLQSPYLCQDAFAILVGEAAMEATSRQNNFLERVKYHTIYGRVRSALHEIWQSRIEFARDVFEARIKDLFNEVIVGDDMKWIENLPAVAKITERLKPAAAKEHHKWMSQLKQYIRGAIYHCVIVNYQEVDIIAQGFRTGTAYNRLLFRDIFNTLDYKERILTRTFWKILTEIQLVGSSVDDPFSNLNVGSRKNTYTIDLSQQSYAKEQELLAVNYIQRITTYSLERLTKSVQRNMATTLATAQVGGDSVVDSDSGAPRKRRFSQRSDERDDDDSNVPPSYDNLPVRQRGESNGTQLREAPARTPLGQGQEVFGTERPSSISFSELADANASTSSIWSRSTTSYHYSSLYIDLCDILQQAEDHIRFLAVPVLTQPNPGMLELDTIDTLVSLEEPETKVLPLWAGGFDDGSGGVFNNEVPSLLHDDFGFGPGRAGLRSQAGSDFDGLSSFGASTANTSKLVNDGDAASVILDRKRVYADSEVESVMYKPVSVAGTDSTWDRVSATKTPAESVVGDVDSVGGLPPESIEAPDFSDAGSVVMSSQAAESVMGDADDGASRSDSKVKFDGAEDEDDEAEEYAAMFMDSDSDDEFDEADLIGSSDGEDDESMEEDYEVVAPAPEDPAAKTSEPQDVKGKGKAPLQIEAANDRRESNPNTPIKYKERALSPLGYTGEAD